MATAVTKSTPLWKIFSLLALISLLFFYFLLMSQDGTSGPGDILRSYYLKIVRNESNFVSLLPNKSSRITLGVSRFSFWSTVHGQKMTSRSLTSTQQNGLTVSKKALISTISSTKLPIPTSPPSPKCGYLVRSFWEGRLGNKMFVYASFYGTVQEQRRRGSNKTAFIRVDRLPSALDTIFEQLSLPQKMIDESWIRSKNFTEIGSKRCCAYEGAKLEQLACDGQNFYLTGGRQSWTYFENYTEEIRREFKFQKTLGEKGQKLLRSLVEEKNLTLGQCEMVGVHLRRGDFAEPAFMNFGHWPASERYLKTAIAFFESVCFSKNYTNTSSFLNEISTNYTIDYSTIRTNCTCLIFLVTGNDYDWNVNAMKRITPQYPDQVYSIVIDTRYSDPSLDMYMMTLTDHMITSTGTFGWWMGFFSKGIVTYEKNYARPNSELAAMYEPKEFFLPGWIPL